MDETSRRPQAGKAVPSGEAALRRRIAALEAEREQLTVALEDAQLQSEAAQQEAQEYRSAAEAAGGLVRELRHRIAQVVRRASPDEAVMAELREARDRAMAIETEYDTANEELQTANEELALAEQHLAEYSHQLEQTVEARTGELRMREARLRSIIDTAPVGVIAIDESGIVESFSAAAEMMFGYAAGEVVGRNVNMLMPSPFREEHDGYLARYLQTGEARIIGIGRNVSAQRKDGTVFPIALAIGEARIGEARIFTGFITDQSERKSMEAQLLQAQKMEAVGLLTGGVAHDFNNLLAVIGGNLEMLERRLKTADGRALLREAQEAVEAGAELTARLLAFGRRQPLQPDTVSLGKLVKGMRSMLRRTLGEDIEIRTRLAGDAGLARVDPQQLENALLNLAINARDAMPDGGRLLIEVAADALDAAYAAANPDVVAGPYVRLSVSDTGGGIPADIRERVIEPFFTTKEPGSGTGLGLSMVYGLTKQSGGHMQIYSEEGYGTTVSLYFPRIDKAAAAAAPAPAAEAPVARGETVLLVEDDARVRRVSAALLAELDYRVVEAVDGPAALEALERGPEIDLLFTDMVMPGGMNGLELARQARRRRPNLKVLFTTGYASPSLTAAQDAETRGLWLRKPFTGAALARMLRRALEAPEPLPANEVQEPG